MPLAGPPGLTSTEDSSHLNEGLLPAFFTFKAVSPTVNGLTGTAQISFAPDSSSAKSSRNDKGGSAIDMREVFFNVDGSFGTISAGRTLGIFQRQAILKDMTLFGVGGVVGPDTGGTTLGRIGYGYIYPEFRTRFSYKTPSMNGFQAEFGVYDPQEPIGGTDYFETDIPQFQGELTYNTTYQGGNIMLWASGMWQEMDTKSFTPTPNEDITSWGWNVGGSIGFSGFELVGSYYSGEALGIDFQSAGTLTAGAGVSTIGGPGASGLFNAPGFSCSTFGTTPTCSEADNDGFYVQGTYTFNGKTKVGISYGETNQDDEALGADGIHFNDVSHEMWTVGVYHDVTSWLKVVAEYNHMEQESHLAPGLPFGTVQIDEIEADIFSVGGFIFW